MHFAYPLPWWAVVLLVALAVVVAAVTYRRRRAGRSLRGNRPLVLTALRASALLALLLVLFRPLLVAAQRNPGGAIVPILVDQSRSMRIADAGGGRRRIDVAVDLLERTLLPRLSGRFQPQVFGFGGVVSVADVGHLSAPDEPRTDLDAALRAIRDRYRDRPVAGVIVLSDGGATLSADDRATGAPLAPIFAIGVGGSGPDREVISLTKSQASLAASLVDLDAVVSSRGLGSEPFDVRLMLHDQPVEVRRVTPADGVPQHVRFTVTPDASPTVYSVEIPVDSREAVGENNSASVLVTPPGRKRRVLFVEGAPGFEHSFLRRAWAADPAVEVDAVVRKGKNDQGQDAFFVQADPARTPALITGFPKTKASLFGYDAIVFGSVEWDFLSRDQLAMTADFVRERGGGVLVLGARSFASPGLAGTPLDETLPLELTSGRPSIALTANESATPARAGDNKLHLTSDGRDHAMMRIAASAGDNEREWASLPPLAATNILGAPRPAASVLAVTTVNGSTRPVVAVQPYGRGRTLEFAGEGSWRWKMLMPAPDRTHELFWRQALRWLSADAPDPVSVVPVEHPQPGTSARIDVLVADGEFHPADNAVVTLRITSPDGQARSMTAPLADRATGRYSARVNLDRGGAYHVEADARQGAQVLGSGEGWFLAGATDPEFADPRLNESVLQRLARDSGGRYVAADEAPAVPGLVQKRAETVTFAASPRDIWQHPIVFVLIAGLLGAEWLLRRRWGFV
jgi:uncharacterized membrane protein